MNIADIFASVRLNLETGKFEADALKSTDLVASKMSATLKKAAGGALGAAAGLAFAWATKGALALDAAMSKLQADTGMTATEAKAAGAALSAMFKTNLQTYDEIAATMAAVHNDLGLIGEAANVATEQMLKFATATGIDAAQAVTLLDDVLDNWGLTAADTQAVMDKVIVSHQKFGGSIQENLVTLAKVAPAMKAANFSIEDGIALLGVFGAKGLDSERAAAAFAKALTKVKSPQELQDLITDISATEDPFKRAEKAADLFGAKAGAQLANALGGVDLEDYRIGMDEAAQATTDAAAAIENALGNRATLALKGFNGALAELGTNLGDLLMIAALIGPSLFGKISALGGALVGVLATTLGPKLAEGLASLWLTAGGGNVVMGAASSAGSSAGWAYVKGFLKVVPIIGIALAGEDTLGRNGAQVQQMWRDLAEKHGVTYYEGWVYGASAGFDQADMNAIGEQAGRDLGQGWTSSAEGAGEEAGGAAVAAFARGSGAYLATANEAGGLTVAEWAAGANAASDTIVSTGKELMAAFHKPVNLARLKTKLAGALHSKALIDGLNSGNPAVRGAAHDQAIAILTYLDALKGPAYIAGRNAALKLAEGMRTALANAARTDTSGFLGNIMPRFAGAIAAIESIYPSYESQVAKLKPSAGTIQGNKDLADVIKALGGEAETAGNKAKGAGDKASKASDKAKDKAKELAAAYKDKLAAAIDDAKDAAHEFFEDLHDANVRAIQDTRDLANAQLDAQIGAINAEVQAARDAVERERDARRQAELERAVAEAETDEERSRAQQALDDFLTDQRIEQMERDAKVKIDALEVQKKANDDLAAAQVEAENERYEAQVKAYDKELVALEAALKKHPEAWAATNAKIVALLDEYGVVIEAEGAKVGEAFAAGIKSAEGAVVAAGEALRDAAGAAISGTVTVAAAPAATVPALAAGGPVTAGMPVIVGERRPELFVPSTDGRILPSLSGIGDLNVGTITINGSSGDPKVMVREFLAELQRERRRQSMSFG